MEDPWPFAQHLDTNYVPTSQELDELKALVAERELVIDGIDAEMVELERKRTVNAQYAQRLRALSTPVRRLPDDILLSIFFELLALAKPWPAPHPSVAASHVCRRWRRLALGTPLLWMRIEIRLTSTSLWDKVYGVKDSLDIRDYVEPYLSLCLRSLRSLEERVRMFKQRSSGCPLQLQAVVHDNARLRSRSFVDPWSEMFEPLAKLISDPTTRWVNVSLDLAVSPQSSLALHFLRMPIASSGLGMQNATIRLQAWSTIPEARWKAVLPEGKLDLRLAQLQSFSIRMAYADMSHIQTSWDSLTTLTFGSPSPSSTFLPLEALLILRLTPNLIHCTIHLSFATSHASPPLDSLTLGHLESLAIIGDVPPRAFAEALNIPALRSLRTDRATGVVEDANAGSVCLWVERYGTRLKEFSVASSSLTNPAIASALKNLPNIEALNLSFDPHASSSPYISSLTNSRLSISTNEAEVLTPLIPDNATGCLCPRLHTLDLELWDGRVDKTMNAIADLVERRRSADRPSSIARLDTLDIGFRFPPGRNVLLDLEHKGVDADGVSIRRRLR
ncbi:hypothetical protein FA13DRAFT_1787307 [Coprinellus micaceus]|uniref:F-box domain-containing protein n=1 Tax=Coprinellus micaceus TaxID=71717 RepID=A0A4Y7TS80_COPMI|nr:hypothetical protein FA13DRAFT_1787307 [Coprinellus micaceus]